MVHGCIDILISTDNFLFYSNSKFQITPLSLKKAEAIKYYNLKAPLGVWGL